MKTAMLTALVLATSAHAANLKELLDAADQNNVDRRISAEQRERALWEYRQAWTSLLPSLSAQGGWTHNQYNAAITIPTGEVDPVTMAPVTRTATIVPYDQFDAAFRADLPIIDVSRWFRTGASSTAYESAAQREQATRDIIKRQVVGAWYGYSAALAIRESAKRSAKVADAQAELQDIRAKAGAATELEMLRARAEAQSRKQVIADTEATVATSRRTLRTLTGIDPGDAAVLPEDDLHAEAGFEELEKNVEQLPAVRSADLDAKAAGTLADAQRLTLIPTVSATFTERLTNATGFTGQSGSYTAGITAAWRLDVPTFMGMSTQGAVERTAVIAAEKSRLQARDQVHSDWQRLNAAIQKIEAAKVQMQAADRAAQVARDRYAAGAATQIDVITAERDLFSAEVGMIQARTELGTARLSLRISAGQPVMAN